MRKALFTTGQRAVLAALALVACSTSKGDSESGTNHDGPATGGSGDFDQGGTGGSAQAGSGGGLGPGPGPGPGAGGGGPGAGGNGTGAGGDGGDVFRPPFILGADVTITLEDEYWGATYTDGGVAKPLERILADHGFNFIRIGTFVDPSAADGYASSLAEPFRNLEQTITLAKRVKAQSLGFLLDLHLSNTWTNPSAQSTPTEWSSLSLDELEIAVKAYTKDAVTQLRDAGARPDMVQVGNEVTNGTLWEKGRVTGNSFVAFARLLKAGIEGVREVDDRIRIMLHIEKCNDLPTSRWWLDGVLAQGVEFDVLGQSCYAPALDANGSVRHAGYQGQPSAWQTTFAALALEYPELEFVIAEYSSRQRAAGDVMLSLPNGRGLGTFNWDPTRFYDTHPNVPLFSTSGAWNHYVVIPELMGLYDQMAEDYGLR